MNRSDCDRIFGASKIEKVDIFKIDGGEVDFGDEPHVLGHPQGDAVACWLKNGKVVVIGKIFSDNFRDPQTATVEFRFRRANGQTETSRASVVSQSFWVASKSIEAPSSKGQFNEVRIRLSRTVHTALGINTKVVATQTLSR